MTVSANHLCAARARARACRNRRPRDDPARRLRVHHRHSARTLHHRIGDLPPIADDSTSSRRSSSAVATAASRSPTAWTASGAFAQLEIHHGEFYAVLGPRSSMPVTVSDIVDRLAHGDDAVRSEWPGSRRNTARRAGRPQRHPHLHIRTRRLQHLRSPLPRFQRRPRSESGPHR